MIGYNNIAGKSTIKYDKEDYKKYVLDPIKERYNQSEEKNEGDESLNHKLKRDVGKTILESVVGKGIFDKIKIEPHLLKKNILKIRYTHNNRRLNNKF